MTGSVLCVESNNFWYSVAVCLPMKNYDIKGHTKSWKVNKENHVANIIETSLQNFDLYLFYFIFLLSREITIYWGLILNSGVFVSVLHILLSVKKIRCTSKKVIRDDSIHSVCIQLPKVTSLKPCPGQRSARLCAVQTVLSQGQRKPWDHVSEESAQRIRLG